MPASPSVLSTPIFTSTGGLKGRTAVGCAAGAGGATAAGALAGDGATAGGGDGWAGGAWEAASAASRASKLRRRTASRGAVRRSIWPSWASAIVRRGGAQWRRGLADGLGAGTSAVLTNPDPRREPVAHHPDCESL